MNKKKLPGKELVFQAVLVLLFTLMLISCIYPFYYIFIASISSPDAVKRRTLPDNLNAIINNNANATLSIKKLDS